MAPNPPWYFLADYIAKFDGLLGNEHYLLDLLNTTDEYPNHIIRGPCLKNHFQIPLTLKPCFP